MTHTNNAHDAGFKAAQRMLKLDDTGEREAIEQAMAWNDTRIDAIRERAELASETAEEWGVLPENDDAHDAWIEGWEAGFVAWFSVPEPADEVEELIKQIHEWSGGHAPHEIDEEEWFEAQGDDTEHNRIVFAMAVEQSLLNEDDAHNNPLGVWTVVEWSRDFDYTDIAPWSDAIRGTVRDAQRAVSAALSDEWTNEEDPEEAWECDAAAYTHVEWSEISDGRWEGYNEATGRRFLLTRVTLA